MRRWYWSLGLVILLGGAWLARGRIFENETTRIQRVLDQLAAEVSFSGEEGNIAVVRRTSAVVDRFAPDASVEVEILGVGTHHLNGRDEIQQSIMGTYRWLKRLSLRFLDPVIELSADGQSAIVHLTATADAVGKEPIPDGFEALEFDFEMRKIEGRWRVQKVTTVPTLKQ